MQTLNIEGNGTIQKTWQELLTQLGPAFEKRSAQYDLQDTFVYENYQQLKEERVFSLAVPKELGGAGISHPEMCQFLKGLAGFCSSTALALSMHQHLVAANVWKYKGGKGGEALLQKVSEKQLTLVSTGAGDWLSSNGTLQKVNGGYVVSAEKHFASQAPVGDILVTSARFCDPEQGWQVLHFGIPFSSEGVHIRDTWYAMGMRGTGSQTVVLENVFVPDSAITLIRPMGEFHNFWAVVLAVAMPLIMSVYVGIAEKAVEIATETARKSKAPYHVYLLGEMSNELTTAQVILSDMIKLANNFDFTPTHDLANEVVKRKTVVTNACLRTVAKAMEIAGGKSYLRKNALERLFRDVNGGFYHPLQEKVQHEFTGNYILDQLK